MKSANDVADAPDSELDETPSDPASPGRPNEALGEVLPADSASFLRATLDGLSSHIAVLDVDGTILLTNKAYRDFALTNGGVPQAVAEGANYFAVCDAGTGAASDDAAAFSAGIRDVLHGRREQCELEYPCHSPGVERWFLARVTPTVGAGPRRAIVAHIDITAKKRAEQERDVILRRFDALARHVPGVLFQCRFRPDGTAQFSYASEGVRQVFGLTPEEIAKDATPVFARVHPEDAARLDEAMRRSARDLTVSREQYRFRLPDGRTVWLESEATPERLPDGSILWHGYSRDITAHRQAEASLSTMEGELRRSERLLRDIERVSSSGGWEYLVESGTMYWTPELYRIHEFPSPDVAHIEESLNCYRPEDRERIRAAFERCVREGIGYDLEVPFVTYRKRARWIRTRTEAVVEGGRVVRVLGSVVDITERKEAEGRLELVTKAVEHASEAIIISDPDHTIRYVNPAFTKVSGYRSEEVIGHTPRVLRSDVHDPTFYDVLHATLAEGREWRGRTVNRRKDGTLYTEETSIVPVHDAAGHVVNYLSTKRDITDFLRAEEERLAAQAQLHQAQKMESIGRLAGGVAHDFNNLLMVIVGCGEMAIESLRPDDPLREDLQEILAAGQRAAGLTRQLLAFSRKQTLSPEVLDLNQLTTRLEKMLGRLIGEHIRLELSLAPELGRIVGDPGQLEQVIMNLVVNARDAMPDGGTLRMETANVPGDRPAVRLVLSDTGCGMSEEVLQQAFEPFFTTKEQGKGTGLGLSTVLGIVKQSGGEVRVSSRVGKGTTFELDFPRAATTGPDGADEAGASLSREGRGHILLVEDEEGLRRMMERRLSGMGYTVTVAANAGEALLLVEEQGVAPDLVMTDLVMPHMSGRHLIERLRRQRPALKFLYMSGYTDDSMIPDAIAGLETAFIQKPFGAEDLAKKLRQILEGGAGPSSRPTPAAARLAVERG